MTKPKKRAATKKSARQRVVAEPCRHPVTRRIGDHCASCGEHVGRKP